MHKSEELLNTILSSIDDLVFAFDEDQRFTFVNCPSSHELLMAEHDIIGKKHEDIMSSEINGHFVRAFKENMTGKIAEYEYSLKTNGKMIGYSCKLSPILNNGKFEGSVALVRDITREKEIRDEQFKKDEIFKQVFENSNMSIQVRDPEGRYILANNSTADKLEKNGDDLVSKDFAEKISDEDREILKNNESKVVRGRFESGSNRYYYDGIKSPLIDPEGQPFAICSITWDTTELEETRNRTIEKVEAYWDLANNIPGIVYRFQIKNKPEVVFFNTMFKETTGYNEKDHTPGRLCPLEPLILPEDRKEVIRVLNKAIKSQQAFEVKYRFRPKNGGIRYLSERGRPVKGEDGKVLYIDGIIFDITERVLAEEKLAKAFDLNPSPMAISAIETGKYIEINRAFEGILGYTKDETIGRSSFELNIWKDPGVRDRLKELIKKNGKITDFEFSLLNKNEEERKGIFSAEIIDLSGEKFLLSTVQDITEQKLAENEIKEQRDFLDTLLNTIPNPIFYKDTQGHYIGYNKSFADFIGMKKKEILDKTFDDIGPKEIVEIYNAKDRELFKNPGTQMYEWKVQTRDGEIRNVIFNKATYNDADGNIAGLIGVISDITDHAVITKKLKKSIEEKDLLLREVYHRVKNNMQLINSMLTLQSRRIKDKTAKTKYDETVDRIHSMALVHELLYQSKDLSKVNIKEYIGRLSNSLIKSYSLASNKINLKTEINFGYKLNINKAIPCGLIINEIVTNSLKYAFAGKETGTIKIELKKSDKRNFLLEISDNGIGIPASIEIGNTDTLGLQLINALIEQLDGKLKIIRKRGTHFSIKFPA